MYKTWIRHYILFNDKRHPADMGAVEVERFLTYLANDRHVSSATQNQALSAILFLYRDVLALDLPWLNGFERSKKTKRLPVVLTPLEVQALLRESSSAPEPVGLIVRLLYGTGMRDSWNRFDYVLRMWYSRARRLLCVMARVVRIG